MKTTKLIGMLGLFLAQMAMAHPGNSRVEINIKGSEVVTAGSVQVAFDLFDKKTQKMVADKDLAITHEKILHVFFFDPALKEFRHEHANYSNGEWSVSTSFKVNGYYWFWVQGQIKKDGEEFAGSERLTVQGGLQANPVRPLGDARIGTDGSSKVAIKSATIRAKTMQMLDLEFSRTDGTVPAITPYLGARAHIVAVTSDGDTLLHVHPMDGASPNQMMAHITFPEKGEYRLWVQFLDAGALKTIPLSLLVK